jgi:hypothetical protein
MFIDAAAAGAMKSRRSIGRAVFDLPQGKPD